MKLLLKMVFWQVLGVAVVFGLHGMLTAEREIALFETDKTHDGRLLAHALSEATALVWEKVGAAGVQTLLKRVSARKDEIRVQLIPADQIINQAHLSNQDQAELATNHEVILFQQDHNHNEILYTYVEVRNHENVIGIIEITENLKAQKTYVQQSISRLGLAILAMIVWTALLGVLLGYQWVSKPVNKLMIKFRAVARGEFLTPVVITQRDEFGMLGRELNHMSESLVEALRRRDVEHSKLIDSEYQLRHAERLNTIGKLASGVAHEIGTPLNVILGHAKMIVRGHVVAQEAQQGAQVIVEQTIRITSIVKQLLGFASRRKPEWKIIDLGQLIAETISLLQYTANKNGVELHMPRSLPSYQIQADTAQIQQVLTNLVTNGIQAMPQGGRLSISVGQRSQKVPNEGNLASGQYYYICVADQGRGISKNDLTHIFEPFFTTKKVGEGTGLGLSVAQGIALDHSGWITVDSEESQGSRFTLYLPFQSE